MTVKDILEKAECTIIIRDSNKGLDMISVNAYTHVLDTRLLSEDLLSTEVRNLKPRDSQTLVVSVRLERKEKND